MTNLKLAKLPQITRVCKRNNFRSAAHFRRNKLFVYNVSSYLLTKIMTVAEFMADIGGDTLFAVEKYAGHMSCFQKIYTQFTITKQLQL